MDIRLTSMPIRTADEVYAHVVALGAVDPDGRPGFLRAFINEIYRLAPLIGINPDWAIAQAGLETGHPTRGLPPFISKIWRERGNPGGIGVTDDYDYGYGFPSGEVAARAHLAHLYVYVHGNEGIDPDIQPYITLDPRWGAVLEKGWEGTVDTIDDLTGKWATDPEYGDGLRTRYRQLIEDAPRLGTTPDPPKETDMRMIQHNVPTAPRPLFLPEWITVYYRWVTHPRTTNRMRVPLQTRSTFHDPGNPRTTHWGELAWLAGGRQGGSLGGYNAITGAAAPGRGEVIFCGYLNENTWHAGTDDGNWTSWGVEAAYGAGMDWDTCFETACALHGALLEAGDRSAAMAVLHQFWTNKWCSAQVLNRGLKGVMMQKIAYYWNLARTARNGGTTSVPVPTPGSYATPALPNMANGTAWDGNSDIVMEHAVYQGQRVKATITNGPLNKRQYASTQALLSGEAYPTGTEVQLLGWVKGEIVDGISEWWVDEDGHRLWAGGFDVVPSEVDNWAELPSEVPTGMVGVNGRIYFPFYPDDLTDEEYEALNGAPPPLGRKITVHRTGNFRKWAGTTEDSPITGTAEEGSEHVFKYWTIGEAVPLTLKDGTEVMESIWYAKDLHSGDRMWAGLSEERPD